ncbi:protein sym-1-like [Glycine soja]|uniref:protein sym-1-like n=1 Tax=Glycine soja TaxID=3848 RepID=UPI000E21B74C|nr:protein sym-1-like [Glycine soja]|eukprot:XP_025983814.1 protein sym-1 [Glycine max]
MSYGGTLCPHAHKFLLLPIAFNHCRQNTTRLQQFQTLTPLHSQSLPFNFNNSATPFKPTLPLLSALPNDGFGGSGPRGGGGGGGGGGSDDLTWFYYRYLALLGKHPVAVKALTSAILNLIGDLLCELVIDKVPSLDFKRTFVFTFLGFALVGPTLHFWYLYMSKLVTLPGASGALLRLVLDQFLFSPIFSGVFLSTLVTLEGSPSQVVPKLKQVLAANVIALMWNIILSFMAHKEVLTK